MFANARMYAINPAVAAAWRALLEWVAVRAEVDVEVIDYPAPAPLPSLGAPDAACVFMCGYPLSQAQPQPRVLAAPVPSPRRYGGRPVYWTDIVVRVDLRSRGSKRHSAIVLHSRPRIAIGLSGAASAPGAARARRIALPPPWGRWSLRRVVEAILAGNADAGPLDSYVQDSCAGTNRSSPAVCGHRRDTTDTDSAARCSHGHCRRRRSTHCRRVDGGRRQRCIGGGPCGAFAGGSRARIGDSRACCERMRSRRTDSATRACFEHHQLEHYNLTHPKTQKRWAASLIAAPIPASRRHPCPLPDVRFLVAIVAACLLAACRRTRRLRRVQELHPTVRRRRDLRAGARGGRDQGRAQDQPGRYADCAKGARGKADRSLSGIHRDDVLVVLKADPMTDQKAVYNKVKAEYAKKGLVVLNEAPMNNTYSIVVRRKRPRSTSSRAVRPRAASRRN